MFNWLSNWFRVRRKRLRLQAPHIERVAAHSGFHLNPALDVHSAQVYEGSPWVYIAINRIAEAGALVPLHVFKLEGEARIGIENHPLERLFSNPNPLTSRFELFEQTLGSLELHGNAYWFLVGDSLGKPREIWVLRPDRVTEAVDRDRFQQAAPEVRDGLYLVPRVVE